MKTVILAVTLIVSMGAVAYADTPGSDWMTKEQITKKLTESGYTDIQKLEADDGHWEGDATKDGKKMEVHVDPHSGAITKSEPDND